MRSIGARVLIAGVVLMVVTACTTAAGPSASTAGATGAAAAGDPVSGTPGQAGQPTTAGGGAGGGGGAVGDPCSLLTQQEISTVVGQPVGPGSSGGSKSCDWQYPANGVPTIQVTIGIEDGDLSGTCDVPSSSALGVSVDQVSGVGDGACFIQMAGLRAGADLVFSKGGQVFSTSVVLGPNATISQIQDADKALALDALGRL